MQNAYCRSSEVDAAAASTRTAVSAHSPCLAAAYERKISTPDGILGHSGVRQSPVHERVARDTHETEESADSAENNKRKPNSGQRSMPQQVPCGKARVTLNDVVIHSD